MALVAGIVLCGVSVKLGFDGKSFLGRPLGGDFVEFYTVGNLLNHYAPERVYDLRLAASLQHATLPTMPETQMLVFAHTPFIATLFQPFALLSYTWAYVAWLAFSAGLYALALALLFRTLGFGPLDRKTGFLLAFSATPFLFETWIGGQMSVVVFFIWVLFFYCLENKRPILGGFVFSLCLFKPTLVAVPVLMLILGRRWRVVAGFAAGAAAMALLSLQTVGLAGCRAWIGTLAMNGNTAAKAGEAWHLAKYLDILAFSHLVLAHWPLAADIAAVAISLIALAFLGSAWWRSDPAQANRLLWAATLCFVLVFNAYTPIYDAILLVLAVVLAASVRQISPGWLLALYLLPWVSQSFAELLHVQALTLALAAFGFAMLGKAGFPLLSRFKPRQEESTMTPPLQLQANGRFQVRSRGLL
ncbi:MAG TPA: glycosyltransferase family 87 protein [Bryobacteraceae bacterium]|nr:glycosyltransferase family 87 protein [Bryobacteraceae bacterium]